MPNRHVPAVCCRQQHAVAIGVRHHQDVANGDFFRAGKQRQNWNGAGVYVKQRRAFGCICQGSRIHYRAGQAVRHAQVVAAHDGGFTCGQRFRVRGRVKRPDDGLGVCVRVEVLAYLRADGVIVTLGGGIGCRLAGLGVQLFRAGDVQRPEGVYGGFDGLGHGLFLVAQNGMSSSMSSKFAAGPGGLGAWRGSCLRPSPWLGAG